MWLGRSLLLLRRSGLSRDFSCEVSLLLPDALAYHVQDEGGNLRAGRFEQLLDAALVVLHEGLPEQRYFLEELLHATLDHLVDDVGGLPRFGRLLGRDVTLLA